MVPSSIVRALRVLARRAGVPPGGILSDLPESIGIPSVIQPDLVKHWHRVLRRSGRVLASMPPATGPRVGILTTLGKGINNPGYAAILAYALRLRGAWPILVYCDAWLDGCEHPTVAYMSAETFIEAGPRPLCAACFAPGAELYREIGLETHALSESLDTATLEGIRRVADALPSERYYDFEHRGMRLGSQVEATVTRFFYTHVPERSERAIRVAHRMVRGALMMAEATTALIERLRIDVLAPHYGAYASRGTAALAAVALGKRCVVWTPGYVDETMLIGDGENAFTELAARSDGPWTDGTLRREQDADLDAVLDALAGRPWAGADGGERVLRAAGVPEGAEAVVLYTNVGFDTKLFYDTPVYPDVLSWIHDSIELFARRPEHLVIRVHPAELWLKVIDKDQTIRAIAERFPRLPPNVHVIPADSPISSYDLARCAKACLVYGSLIGLELAARGRPVVVAGRGLYSGKGFTWDVRSRDEYARHVAGLYAMRSDDPARTARARRFAYYFYVERQIPFAPWNHDHRAGIRLPDWWRTFRSLEDLLPGRDPNLDAICDQLLHGREALNARAMPPPRDAPARTDTVEAE